MSNAANKLLYGSIKVDTICETTEGMYRCIIMSKAALERAYGTGVVRCDTRRYYLFRDVFIDLPIKLDYENKEFDTIVEAKKYMLQKFNTALEMEREYLDDHHDDALGAILP